MGERLTVVVDDGISDMLLKLAGSSRQQGRYISGLVRAAWQNDQAGSAADLDFEGLRLQVLALAGQHKMLEGRLLVVEKELAALIAERQPEVRGQA
jgi:hypothetical protein